MTTAIPEWVAQPWQGVHNIPSAYLVAQQPLSWEQTKATAQFWVDSIIGRIAIAFGGINILGWKPLQFLSDWGYERIEQARRNYEAAMQAQSTANYAQTQIAILTGGSLASDVHGGVSLSETFTGAAADTLGAQFQRHSDGSGGGKFGPNGTGQAAWKKSGGLTRRHYDIASTSLGTDYQAVFVVISEPPQSPKVGFVVGNGSYTYLICRSNTAGTTFVYARIGYYDLELGRMVSGAWQAWKNIILGDRGKDTGWVSRGDQIVLIAGTDVNIGQFSVRRNGIELLEWTDVAKSSTAGAGFRHVGLASEAADRNVYTDQTVPASLEVWSAADRKPTSIPR